jgi:hypothetical protein
MMLRSKTVDSSAEEIDLGSREKSLDVEESAIERVRLEVNEENNEAVSQSVLEAETPSLRIDTSDRDKNSKGDETQSLEMVMIMNMMQQLLQGQKEAKQAQEKTDKQFQGMREENKQAQEKVDNQLQGLREDVKQTQEVQKQAQESTDQLFQELKEGLQKGLEQAALECRKSNEVLRQELSERVNVEVGKLNVDINNVRKDIKKCENKLEREMAGVKRQFEKEREDQELAIRQLAAHQETELERVNVCNAEVLSAVVTAKQEVKAIQERLSRVEGTTHDLEHVNSTVQQIQEQLNNNMSTVSRQLGECDKRIEQKLTQFEQRVINPVPLPAYPPDPAADQGTRAPSLSRVEPSTTCAHQDVGFVAPALSGRLGSTEFALPMFDENQGMNPRLHIGQLEEFLQFRGIPPQHWLAVAKKSIVGSVSKQWLGAVNSNLSSYEQFKKKFLDTWWSAAQQGRVKNTLYRSTYEKRAGLSMSAHLLKFATMASYLEPKLTENEIIEAIRCHYPTKIQELLVSTRLDSVAEFLEVLNRLELVEERNESSGVASGFNQPTQNFSANRDRNDRQEGPGPIRQVQHHHRGSRGGWRGAPGRGNFRRNEDFRNEGPDSEEYAPNRETNRGSSPGGRRPGAPEEN